MGQGSFYNWKIIGANCTFDIFVNFPYSLLSHPLKLLMAIFGLYETSLKIDDDAYFQGKLFKHKFKL